MGSIRIAPELLLLILEYITSPMVLTKLCLLDTQTRDLILPILYKTCDINSLGGVSAFCKAIKGNASLRPLVKDLRLSCVPPSPKWNGENPNDYIEMLGLHPSKELQPEPKEPIWTGEIVSELREALGLLPNVNAMTLADGKGLASVFDGLQVSFQLKVLGTVHFPGDGFIQFLQSQSSIEVLRLQGLSYASGEGSDSEFDSDDDFGWDNDFLPGRGVPDNIINQAADLSFLPSLRFLATEPLKCTALAPGRPITLVDVTQNGAVPWLSHDQYRELEEALGKTSVPLRSLEFTSRLIKPREVDSWEFLDFLCETSVPETLRALVLHDTAGNLMGFSNGYPFLWSKAQLLGEKFKVLERFEVPIRDDTMGIGLTRPLAQIWRDGLIGAMGELSTWQMACPTLKKVMLYDIEIV